MPSKKPIKYLKISTSGSSPSTYSHTAIRNLHTNPLKRTNMTTVPNVIVWSPKDERVTGKPLGGFKKVHAHFRPLREDPTRLSIKAANRDKETLHEPVADPGASSTASA
ncbi:MAG: hypothetical protein MMC23_003300 [Stictis urceolatum]|nr:hypothetical protein [Stictis urceolata]